MWSREAQIPYRQVTRRLSSMYLDALRHGLAVVGPNPERTPYFNLIATIAVEDWCGAQDIGQKAEPTARISINAIAASLNAPFETARRHVNAMIKDGLLTRRGTALYLDPVDARRAEIIGYYRNIRADLIKLIMHLHQDGLPMPPLASSLVEKPDQFDVRVLVKGAFDLILVPYENNRDDHANWYEINLYGMYNLMNVMHIADDPVLAKTYGIELVPDEMRKPVSIRALAKLLALPYSTVWRHTLSMIENGMAVRRDSGIVIPTEVIESTLENSERNGQYLYKVIDRSLIEVPQN